MWIGLNLALRGETGGATGWFGRARRLVERDGSDCVERGYLLMPVMFERAAAGDPDGAVAAAAEAAAIGERFGDADLFALAAQDQGALLIAQGRVPEGLRLLDEAMLAVTAGELSPMVNGFVYCGVIMGCQAAYEPRRAQEWTAALSRWCERQPDMVSFTGACLVHRSEIMQLRGAWTDALQEARRARERCELAMNRSAGAQALYRQGELHRLRGEFAAAEEAYQAARQGGWEPQPGLALLRLAQGNGDAAAAAIRRMLVRDARRLAAGGAAARRGRDPARGRRRRGRRATPAGSSARSPRPGRAGWSARWPRTRAGRSSWPAATRRPRSSRCATRAQAWRELDAPYEAARSRVLVGLTCRALGDEDTAALELDAAREVFARLGAAPDVARIDEPRRPTRTG